MKSRAERRRTQGIQDDPRRPGIFKCLPSTGGLQRERSNPTFLRALLSWVLRSDLVGIWYFLMKRMGSQQAGFRPGKNKAKILLEND